MADLSTVVTGMDTLYACVKNEGLFKFSLVSGTWVGNDAFLTPCFALDGQIVGSSVILYYTRNTSPATPVYRLVDTTGYNIGFTTMTFQTFVTAGPTIGIKGVAITSGVSTAVSLVVRFRMDQISLALLLIMLLTK